MPESYIETQARVINNLNKYFLRISAALIVLFVLAQFFILATLGTKGAEIAQLRQQKEVLRIQNEYIRSEIDKSKTLSQIQEGLNNVVDLQSKDLKVINSYDSTNSIGSAEGLSR